MRGKVFIAQAKYLSRYGCILGISQKIIHTLYFIICIPWYLGCVSEAKSRQGKPFRARYSIQMQLAGPVQTLVEKIDNPGFKVRTLSTRQPLMKTRHSVQAQPPAQSLQNVAQSRRLVLRQYMRLNNPRNRVFRSRNLRGLQESNQNDYFRSQNFRTSQNRNNGRLSFNLNPRRLRGGLRRNRAHPHPYRYQRPLPSRRIYSRQQHFAPQPFAENHRTIKSFDFHPPVEFPTFRAPMKFVKVDGLLKGVIHNYPRNEITDHEVNFNPIDDGLLQGVVGIRNKVNKFPPIINDIDYDYLDEFDDGDHFNAISVDDHQHLPPRNSRPSIDYYEYESGPEEEDPLIAPLKKLNFDTHPGQEPTLNLGDPYYNQIRHEHGENIGHHLHDDFIQNDIDQTDFFPDHQPDRHQRLPDHYQPPRDFETKLEDLRPFLESGRQPIHHEGYFENEEDNEVHDLQPYRGQGSRVPEHDHPYNSEIQDHHSHYDHSEPSHEVVHDPYRKDGPDYTEDKGEKCCLFNDLYLEEALLFANICLHQHFHVLHLLHRFNQFSCIKGTMTEKNHDSHAARKLEFFHCYSLTCKN